MNYEPGMLLAFKWDTDTYGICKVLKITETKKEPIVNIITYSNWFQTLPETIDPDEIKPLVIHMPMILSAMEKSGCKPIGTAEVKPEELQGYENWVRAWNERRSGFFERSIAESVDQILESMAHVDNTPEDSVFKERLMRRWQQNMP